jgi:hypothetical protein
MEMEEEWTVLARQIGDLLQDEEWTVLARQIGDLLQDFVCGIGPVHTGSARRRNHLAFGYMIIYRRGVEDLAGTRFAISPLQETVCSLWAVSDPGRAALHLPWLRSIQPGLEALDTRLMLSIVAPTRALPDLLTRARSSSRRRSRTSWRSGGRRRPTGCARTSRRPIGPTPAPT